MAWFVTGDYVPDEWSPEERDALAAFRGAQPKPPPTSERRAWHFRGFRFPDGSRASRGWLDGDFVSTFWAELGPIESGLTMDEISERVREVFPDDPPGRQRTTTGNVYRFATGIKVGDLVLTTEGSSVYVGRVTGESTWIVDAHPWIARRRGVEWLNAESPALRGELSPGLQASLKAPFAVARISQADEVAALAGSLAATSSATPHSATGDASRGRLPLLRCRSSSGDGRSARAEAAARVYGPPGTGKTLVAQALAEHLTAEGGDWELAQFHPSYSYEDFMEGYRPTASADGAVSYELRPGPLRRIAADAENDPGNPYVLVVDEINRGNIPKIFGELLFLLEYRDKPIALPVLARQHFTLPQNLFVIGTMNTADRSIALVDTALRRRFYFVPFSRPSRPSARYYGGGSRPRIVTIFGTPPRRAEQPHWEG